MCTSVWHFTVLVDFGEICFNHIGEIKVVFNLSDKSVLVLSVGILFVSYRTNC